MPRPAADGETIDSRPHLPPQPTVRIDIRGMGFRLRSAEGARIRQAVRWAYGTEDLLAIEPLDAEAMRAYLAAVSGTGIPEVWRRKRPRVEQAPMAVVGQLQVLASLGLVAVQRPDGTVPLASLVQADVPLALATGAATRPLQALAAATAPAAGPERLTMEQAVTALTRGSAYAELADRDKGHLTVGALADLAVLSVDPFAPDTDLSSARSVLTLIGGRVVHDVP
jgi:imidazolonepropionase-like amidohydrolase